MSSTNFEAKFGSPEKLAAVIDKVTFICNSKINSQSGDRCQYWCPLLSICGNTEEELVDYLNETCEA